MTSLLISACYYDVEEEPETVVFVLAVGIKHRNRVRIGTEVIEL